MPEEVFDALKLGVELHAAKDEKDDALTSSSDALPARDHMR
jgi:hypothetical protein